MIGYLLTLWAAAAQPIPTATAKLTARGMLLSLPDLTLNRSWVLEESTNLTQWRAYFTNGGGFNNRFTVTNLAPAHRWFRWRPFEGAPVIVWDPIIADGPDFTDIQAAVAGSLPMSYRWYRDGTLLSGADMSVGTAPSLRLGVFTYHDNGLYRLVARNSFGSVTSAPTPFMLPLPPDYTPVSIAGRVIEVNVQSAGFPFVAPALYRLKPAKTGNTYVIEGLINVPNSSGTYAYQRIDGIDGRVDFVDSITGASTTRLTFTSATTGTFVLSKVGLSGTATGEFSITQ